MRTYCNISTDVLCEWLDEAEPQAEAGDVYAESTARAIWAELAIRADEELARPEARAAALHDVPGEIDMSGPNGGRIE